MHLGFHKKIDHDKTLIGNESDKSIINFSLIKSWKRYFISLYAFYPIMYLMKSPKKFEKIAILKIWRLVFFWGVKINLGEKYAWFVIKILIHGSK